MVTVRSNFDTLQEISERHTSNDKYEKFVTTHIKANRIPTKPRAKYRFPWGSIAGMENEL